jgi:hypothetical protein
LGLRKWLLTGASFFILLHQETPSFWTKGQSASRHRGKNNENGYPARIAPEATLDAHHRISSGMPHSHDAL